MIIVSLGSRLRFFFCLDWSRFVRRLRRFFFCRLGGRSRLAFGSRLFGGHFADSGASSIVDEKERLPNLNRLPLLDQELSDLSRNGSGHFDRALFRFHFHQRLTSRYGVSRRYFDVQNVPAGEILTQLGQLDFDRHTSPQWAGQLGLTLAED